MSNGFICCPFVPRIWFCVPPWFVVWFRESPRFGWRVRTMKHHRIGELCLGPVAVTVTLPKGDKR